MFLAGKWTSNKQGSVTVLLNWARGAGLGSLGWLLGDLGWLGGELKIHNYKR